MGIPHQSASIKQLVDAAQRSNWDIELANRPDTVSLLLTHGETGDQFQLIQTRQPGTDGSGRETTKYRTAEISRRFPDRTWPIGSSIAQARNFIDANVAYRA